MSTKEFHGKVPCPTCYGGLIPLNHAARVVVRKGMKAGTAGDWVECTDCQGTKGVEIMERLITPTARSLVVNGLRKDG